MPKQLNLTSHNLFRFMIDIVFWILSFHLAIYLRFDFHQQPQLFVRVTCIAIVGVVIFRFLLILDTKLFGGYKESSLDEVEAYARSGALITLLLTLGLISFEGTFLPRSTSILGVLISLGITLIVRQYYRKIINFKYRNQDRHRTLIYGAGDIGEQVVKQMQQMALSNFKAVGLVDDNPAKRKFKLNGVSVLGSFEDLDLLIEELKVDYLFVAISTLNHEKLRLVQLACSRHQVTMRIVPPLVHNLGINLTLNDFHEIQVNELIGRNSHTIVHQESSNSLKGKKILVTGGGGSIGAEICAQLLQHKPKSIGIVERDESALLEISQTLNNFQQDIAITLFLGDIRDTERLSEIFMSYQPNAVFHAAALKHVNFLQAEPMEAFKTNVIGTFNLLEQALASEVELFVNISTDKAADPISILGVSKLITEKLTASAPVHGTRPNSRFISVRFGNVFGSRGSALHTFSKQISLGGPITVTDPEVERFFMTIEEAVSLVIAAANLGKTGEVMILDMGESVKIMDLVNKLKKISKAEETEIEFIGLKEGEKMKEVLFGRNETPIPTLNSQIFCVESEKIDWDRENLFTLYDFAIQELKSGM